MSTFEEASNISLETYLALEKKAAGRHEYRGGSIRTMTGADVNHNLISLNLVGGLRETLKGRGCKVFAHDVKVYASASNHFFYPDVFVTCGPLDLFARRKDVVTNPVLIIEVLSDSTTGYDRGSKFTHYRSFASLHEYVVVEQGLAQVDCFSLDEQGAWEFRSYTDMEAAVMLKSLGVEVRMRDVYEGVEWEAAE